MRGLLVGWLASVFLLMSVCAPLSAQGAPPTQPPTEEAKKTDPPPPAPPAPQPKAARDESSGVMHYTLAAIGTIIVMILICMPLRRE